MGKVVWHSLKSDGTISRYDIRFGDRVLRRIPARLVESINEVTHEHEER